jgi:S1-C subfamily serine protease
MPTATPVTVTTTAKKYAIGLLDIGKGLVVAVISPVIPIIYATLQSGSFVMPWKNIGITAASAFVAYIAKNFFSPSTTTITGAPEGSAINIPATPTAGKTINTIATK